MSAGADTGNGTRLSARRSAASMAFCLGFAILLACFGASAAQASFGLREFDVTYEEEDGTPATQAGIHPYAMKTTALYNEIVKNAEIAPDGEVKDLNVQLPPGFAGNPSATPLCTTADFLTRINEVPACPDSTAIGVVTPWSVNPGPGHVQAVFNLVPPPGVVSKLGFYGSNILPITIEVGLSKHAPYKVEARVSNITQAAYVYGSELTLWGDPASPVHDKERGRCVIFAGECKTNIPQVPFITLPRSCTGPLPTSYTTDSWQRPGSLLADGEPDLSDPAWLSGISETHDAAEPPNPEGLSGCGRLPFSPSTTAKPTSRAASSPTGLDFSLDVNDEGFDSPTGIAASDIRETVVTLPEGFTTNPSLAEGLNVCTEAQLEKETAFSAPGAGCPDASKIGTVEVETPELPEKILHGSLFIAKPYENPFGSLLALYIDIKSPELGINVVQPLKIENDPTTGRIKTVAEEMPQVPISHFRLHFREGTRSPLSTPPACGNYNVSTEFVPWSGGTPTTSTAGFQIATGSEAGPCPSGTSQPFHPGLEAGTLNNAAGTYSPFYTHLTRNDGEQEITHFSIKLPPGVVGKLAGIPFCSDAQIAQAQGRTGPHGGEEEINSPSCPAASEVGHSLAGAGVGPSLAYAPGKLYLAGPYHGSQLSLVSITAAKVGPFDLGTVVVRFALKINPETAEVFVDAAGSDPLPHIIKGIPVHLRDIRAYVDRPNFVLNPTNCERTSTASTVLGSGTNFASEADDQPITVTSPFQAADCASLGFAPKLALSLKGATKRGGTPALKATLTYPKGSYANIKSAQVTLPHSEFLEQAHIKTICTRVQFAAGAGNGSECPAASIYGKAKAITPILSDPLEGPVYLRSSSHQLPDLVAALHNGEINIDLDGHIDSVGKNGQIRNTFEAVPDAPVTKFTLELQGGKKGLLVNSTNLCKSTNRAIAAFTGQNGKRHDFEPVLKAQCPKGRKGKGAASHGSR
jgi:hypothetical protein